MIRLAGLVALTLGITVLWLEHEALICMATATWRKR